MIIDTVPHVFIFDRFIHRIRAGKKKQNLICTRSRIAPDAGQPFNLVRRLDGDRVTFASGVCTKRERVIVKLHPKFDRIKFAPGEYEINSVTSFLLEDFATAEGFDTWAEFRKFHLEGQRTYFHGIVVHWNHLEFMPSFEARGVA